MDDIRFIKNGWIMLIELMSRRIVIGEANQWLEDFIMMGLTHETIHLVIDDLEGLDASDKFDNIFGYADPTVLLLPEDKSEFNSVQRHRLEKVFWNAKGKRINSSKRRENES